MHELLSAVGIDTIPPGESEATLVKKILTDNFFYNKVLARLVDEWSVGVAEKLPWIEREALRNRIVPSKAAQKPAVEWALVYPDKAADGKMQITATCGNETIRWNGKNVKAFRFRGEPVPGEIAYIYEEYLKIPYNPCAEMDQMTRAWDRDNAKRYPDLNRVLSPEEALAAAALKKQFPNG